MSIIKALSIISQVIFELCIIERHLIDKKQTMWGDNKNELRFFKTVILNEIKQSETNKVSTLIMKYRYNILTYRTIWSMDNILVFYIIEKKNDNLCVYLCVWVCVCIIFDVPIIVEVMKLTFASKFSNLINYQRTKRKLDFD